MNAFQSNAFQNNAFQVDAAVTGAPSYGGHTPEQEQAWLAAAQKLMELTRQLEAAKNSPPQEQREAVAAAVETIEQVEADTGIEAPDMRNAASQLEKARREIEAFAEKLTAEMQRRDRARRNNNWLMMQ